MSDIVITPDQPDADEAPADINILLAAALGACECWGLRADCDLCQGQGSAGWTEPDPELFDEFVGPAIARLSGRPGRRSPAARHRARPDDSDNHQTAQGENA